MASKVEQISGDFALWSDNDLKEYMQNKVDAQKKYDETGKWDMDLYSRNSEIRNKYGVTEDKYQYSEIQSYASDRLGNYFNKPLFGKNSSLSSGTDSSISGGGTSISGGGTSISNSLGLGGEQFQMIIGIGVLYMFLSLFKR